MSKKKFKDYYYDGNDASAKPLKNGAKVKLSSNIKEYSAADYEHTAVEHKKFLKHIEHTGTIVSVDIKGEDHESSYYSVKFNDGFELNAFSGYHLIPAK